MFTLYQVNTYDQCLNGKTDFIFNVVVDIIVSCRPLQVQKGSSKFDKVDKVTGKQRI